jgi:hypothetical protein
MRVKGAGYSHAMEDLFTDNKNKHTWIHTSGVVACVESLTYPTIFSAGIVLSWACVSWSWRKREIKRLIETLNCYRRGKRTVSNSVACNMKTIIIESFVAATSFKSMEET